jgi:hypothetical protein
MEANMGLRDADLRVARTVPQTRTRKRSGQVEGM